MRLLIVAVAALLLAGCVSDREALQDALDRANRLLDQIEAELAYAQELLDEGDGTPSVPTPDVEPLPFPLPDATCDTACQVTDGNSVAGEHHGLYAVFEAALSLQHLPIYTSGPYLRVGVDQGSTMSILPIVGTRADMDIRHGYVADGVGSAVLRDYLEDASAKRHYAEPPLIRVVGTPDARQRSLIKAAVRAVNAGLPPAARMRLGPSLPADHNVTGVSYFGTIAVKFVPAGNLGGRTAGRTTGMWRTDPAGKIVGASKLILLDSGANVFDPDDLGGERRGVILIAHELMHALGVGHVSPTFDTIIANNTDMYRLRQGDQQPTSLLYPVDREALRVLYEGHDPADFGPWGSTSIHLHGNAAHVGFGVARRNGYAEPYAYGLAPASSLADNRALSGSATWEGSLLGFTPSAEAVAGDAEIGVDLSTLAGTADFTSLEAWTAGAAPGAAGTGSQWLDGDLGYTIAVAGNTFQQTDGDDGTLTGIFTGHQHEGAAGTLERSDLTAAFGASR